MFKKIIFILVAALVVTSCKKDPVNVSNGGTGYNSSEYPKKLNDLLGVLGAGYGNLRNAPSLFGWKLGPETFSCLDHSIVPCFDFDASWTEMVYGKLSVTNGLANDMWADLYAGVKDANAFFDRSDFFEKYYMLPSEQQQVNYMRGEAHFLRALYYFYLECFYGESYITSAGGGDKLGVVLYTQLPQSIAETQLPRSTVRQTWDFIINDLKQSATLLEGVSWPQNYKGRATDWSAKALLGKAYVFTQDWTNAKTTLKDVIDHSGKSLMPFAKYKKSFNDIDENNVPNNNEFNEESLFELNLDRVGDSYGIFSDQSPNTALTSIAGRLWSPACLGDDGTEAGGDNVLGFCNEVIPDKNLARFGFNLPAFTLSPNPAYTGSNPSLLNPQQVIDPVYKAASLTLRNTKAVDPRLYVCALEPWVDSVSVESSPFGYRSRPVARIPGAQRPGLLAWNFRKYTTIDHTIYFHNNNDGANYYILRLADVYLLYAEACMNSGDNPTALEYVNKVHRRAYDLPINTANATFDYASLAATTKAPDANLSNNPLRYERYAELFGEGHWWFDVCRWKIGQGEATYFGSLLPQGRISDWSETRSYSLPIPSNEINTNISIVHQQNPGY
jgi:hypothetical protein